MIADLRKILPLRLQVATLFLFAMWLFFQAYQPWEPIDNDLLLESGQFNNATDRFGWSREQGYVQWTDDTGYVTLSPSSRLRFNLPIFSGDLLLASGKIRTEQLESRRNQWDAGRIMLYFENEQGKIIWNHPHNVGFMTGTSDWTRFATSIEVPDFAHRGWVELANYGKSGLASFDDISVRPAVWKKAFAHWQLTFGMLWAAILMWIVLNTPIWKQRWGKSLMVTGLLIIVGVTLPPTLLFEVANRGVSITNSMLKTEELDQRQQASASQTVKPVKLNKPPSVNKPAHPADVDTEVIQETVMDSPPMVTPHILQKMGHPALFAVLGLFAWLAFSTRQDKGLLIYSLLLFAASTEVLQLVVGGRHFLLSDFVLDMSGTLTGLVVAWVTSFFYPQLLAKSD